MVIRLTVIFLLVVSSLYLNAQINILGARTSLTTSDGQKELVVASKEYIIVYPMVKGFSSKVFALVDFSKISKFGDQKAYVSFLEKKNDTKTKVKKMVFHSEADLINYFTKNDFEYKDANNTFFVFQKK